MLRESEREGQKKGEKWKLHVIKLDLYIMV